MLYYAVTVSRILTLIFWWSLGLLGWSHARSKVAWYRESFLGTVGAFEYPRDAAGFPADEDMRVLVTGGAGFTGSHLVERLLDWGMRSSA